MVNFIVSEFRILKDHLKTFTPREDTCKRTRRASERELRGRRTKSRVRRTVEK